MQVFVLFPQMSRRGWTPSPGNYNFSISPARRWRRSHAAQEVVTHLKDNFISGLRYGTRIGGKTVTLPGGNLFQTVW